MAGLLSGKPPVWVLGAPSSRHAQQERPLYDGQWLGVGVGLWLERVIFGTYFTLDLVLVPPRQHGLVCTPDVANSPVQ